MLKLIVNQFKLVFISYLTLFLPLISESDISLA